VTAAALSEKIGQFYLFLDNFGKNGSIFIIFSLLKFRRDITKKLELKLSSNICCHTTLRKVNVHLNSFTFIV